MRDHLAMRRPPAPRGFTVIEVLIVLALLVAATALVVPSLANLLPSARLDNAADLIQATILDTRADAVRDGRTRVVALAPRADGSVELRVEVHADESIDLSTVADSGHAEDEDRPSLPEPSREGASKPTPTRAARRSATPGPAARDADPRGGAASDSSPAPRLVPLTDGVAVSAGPRTDGFDNSPVLPPIESPLRLATVLADGTIWPGSPICLSAGGETRRFAVRAWDGMLRAEPLAALGAAPADRPTDPSLDSREPTPPFEPAPAEPGP